MQCLPEQRHYYYLSVDTTLPGSSDHHPKPSELGGSLSKVPFIHPGNIFNIITVCYSEKNSMYIVITMSCVLLLQLLRKQLVYNTLVSSCIGIMGQDVGFGTLVHWISTCIHCIS